MLFMNRWWIPYLYKWLNAPHLGTTWIERWSGWWRWPIGSSALKQTVILGKFDNYIMRPGNQHIVIWCLQVIYSNWRQQLGGRNSGGKICCWSCGCLHIWSGQTCKLWGVGRTVFAICSPALSSSWHWSAVNNPGPPSLEGGLSTELSTCSGK